MENSETEKGNVPLAEINIGLLADQVGVAATNTLDLGQSVHDVLLAVNIGVEQTQNVLEVRLLAGHERCSSMRIPVSPNMSVPRPIAISSIVAGSFQNAFHVCRAEQGHNVHMMGELARLARDADVEMWQV